MIYYILLGRIYSCPEGKGTRGVQGPIPKTMGFSLKETLPYRFFVIP